MYITYEKAQECKKAIQEFLEMRGDFNVVEYLFYGAGDISQRLVDYFKKEEIPLPIAMVDRNMKLHGTKIEEIPVISLEEAKRKYNHLKILIASSDYGYEIYSNLVKEWKEANLFNIARYFVVDRPIINEIQRELRPEIKLRLERYKEMLVSDNFNKIFQLKAKTDMPEDVIELLQIREEYITLSLTEKMIEIPEIFREELNNYVGTFLDDESFPKTVIELLGLKEIHGIFKIKKNGREYLLNSGNGAVQLSDISKGQEIAEDISMFSSYLEDREIPFLYVQLPGKPSMVNIELDLPLGDACNILVSNIMEHLRKNQVQVLDYRQIMLDEKMDFLETFFQTDIHWKPSAAFKANEIICREVAKILKIQLEEDKFNPVNYEWIKYPDIFLGRTGKKVGLFYSGVDDFELIVPKYPTDYTWECKEKGYWKRGVAEQALLFQPLLDWDYYALNPYGVYSLQGSGLSITYNHLSNNLIKLLILQDSFTNPLASFIAPHFAEIHFVDMRGEMDNKKLLKLIAEVKPYMVLMMHSLGVNYVRALTEINPWKDYSVK